MERHEIESGSIVVSLKGRDAGKVYLVKEVREHYLYLCDGATKRLACPKKKKDKHVRLLGASPAIGEKLTGRRQVFDSEIYSALRGYRADGIKN